MEDYVSELKKQSKTLLDIVEETVTTFGEAGESLMVEGRMNISPSLKEGIDYIDIAKGSTSPIFEVLTHKAMESFGQHTAWGVKDKKFFDMYSKEGYRFFVAINLNSGRRDPMHKVIFGAKNGKIDTIFDASDKEIRGEGVFTPYIEAYLQNNHKGHSWLKNVKG
jgi:hypothetical protein